MVPGHPADFYSRLYLCSCQYCNCRHSYRTHLLYRTGIAGTALFSPAEENNKSSPSLMSMMLSISMSVLGSCQRRRSGFLGADWGSSGNYKNISSHPTPVQEACFTFCECQPSNLKSNTKSNCSTLYIKIPGSKYRSQRSVAVNIDLKSVEPYLNSGNNSSEDR